MNFRFFSNLKPIISNFPRSLQNGKSNNSISFIQTNSLNQCKTISSNFHSSAQLQSNFIGIGSKRLNWPLLMKRGKKKRKEFSPYYKPVSKTSEAGKLTVIDDVFQFFSFKKTIIFTLQIFSLNGINFLL